jgi:hypothetical protein
MLDPGAKVSLLSKATYEQYFVNIPLRVPQLELHTYDGSSIKVLGCIRCSVQYGDVILHNFTFYVATSGRSVMGIDLFEALGFKMISPAGATISAETSVTLSQYPEILKEFGCIRDYQHRPMINSSVTPVGQPLRRLPLTLRDEVTAELERMVKLDLIEKINASPWVSNLVLVRMPDKKIRVCIDLTCVNKAIIPDAYPLATFEELTSQLAGSTVFSKIDLRWGYLQVMLADDSRDLTAFVTHEGLYRFKRLGICSGPAAFQKIIKSITVGLDGVVNLLDDVQVHGRTVQEHDKRLATVLQRLSDHQATINTDKTVLGAKSIDFDGFQITADGVRPTESHTRALRELKPPTNVKELQSLLEAVGFYMRFVPHYANLVEPLRDLLRHNVEWQWTTTCQSAFDVIDRIASATSLAHFNSGSKVTTVVTTDASSVALGACLSQVIDSEERPIAFASRVLTPTERNYSATEREALACLWACEHWHFYTYGRKLLLLTDHQALRVLFTALGKGHRPLRLHRWADRLLQYNFDIQYKSGERIALADYLSKMGITLDYDTAKLSAIYTVSTIFGSTDIPVLMSAELQAATSSDAMLQTVCQRVTDGWPTKPCVPAKLRPYHDVRAALPISDDGLLMKDDVVVVPASLRGRVLELVHESHPGMVRMKQRCRTTVWWSGLNNDIERHVRHCVPCRVSGKSSHPTTPPLQPIDFPPKPWQTLAIDIFGEVQWAPHFQRFVIVLVDLHSKWPEVAVCGTVTSASIINFLTEIFYRHGLPEVIISDNGSQFTSNEFSAFITSLGITHRLTAVYNPTANGACERMNKVIKEGLAVAYAESAQFLPALKELLQTTGLSHML